MAIRRSAFERMGRFDEGLHGRGNEEDWEFRYTAAGGRIRYLARAGLDHRREPDDSRLAVLTRAAYGQGREARRHDVRTGSTRPIRSELRILAGYAWHKCMNAIFWQTRDPYPRDDWHEFLNTVGVDEEIIGTPHCSSPRDTDELDAQ